MLEFANVGEVMPVFSSKEEALRSTVQYAQDELAFKRISFEAAYAG